jgi:hypothetical protein
LEADRPEQVRIYDLATNNRIEHESGILNVGQGI